MPTSSSSTRWVFSTQGVDGTLTIGACFVFLAYVLHPAIESAYKRVRAYRAWRAIEKSQSVEVTNYHTMEEVFGGRGKWDAARVITVLLAVFSLASWGLELSVDLAYFEGDADLLNRPPPVTVRNVNGTKDWQVKSKEMFDQANWRDLPNMLEDGAKSRYYMKSNTGYEGPVNGAIKVAYWYTEASRTPSQFYYIGGMNPTVKNLECTDNESPDVKNVYHGDETRWGSVYECVRGPSLTSDLLAQYERKTISPPTIVMTKSDGKVFVVVEESSSYPSFMYSVWTVGSVDGASTELQHEFHIAATMRLAEAVVTTIVHGEITGGGCFGLLRKFSETLQFGEDVFLRASPFGEHPTGDIVQIQEFEHIEVGLVISANALGCFVCLMLLTVIGIMWLFVLGSSVGMDVYDRDELIRAVSMSGTTGGCTLPSAMRIFVRKEDSGEIKVVIKDSRGARTGCERFIRKGKNVVKCAVPILKTTAVAPCSDDFADASEATESREVVLEGMRVRLSKAASDPNRFFRCPASVSLIASPVISSCTSLPGVSARFPWQPASVERVDGGYKGGRGEPVVFDTLHCSGDRIDSVSNACVSAVAARPGSSSTSPIFGRGGLSARSGNGRPSDVAVAEQLGRGTDVTPGLSPLPPLLKADDLTVRAPISAHLARSCDDKVLEDTRFPGDAC